MEFENLELKIDVGAAKEITVRQGEAAKVHDPVRVDIVGLLSAPAKFYQARKELISRSGDGYDNLYFDRRETMVIVDRQKRMIRLLHQESSPFSTSITGVLEISPEFAALNINTGKVFTPAELGKLLRSRRHLFPNQENGMKLVGDLLGFTATVNTQVENKQDTRANKRTSVETAVATNLPVEFQLRIPIFKGAEPEVVNIEILLDTRGAGVVECFLEAPEISQKIEERRDQIFEAELKPFIDDKITILEI